MKNDDATMGSMSNEDVSRIVALLSGIIEQRQLPIADLRRKFLDGLGVILETPHWVWAHSVADEQERPSFFSMLHSAAYTPDQINALHIASSDPRYMDDTRKAMGGAWDREHFTVMRVVFNPDVYWNDSTHPMSMLRDAGIDDCIWSLYRLGPRAISGISFSRMRGMPKFAAREQNIVHVVMAQVDWLHREGTDVPAVKYVAELSPRERCVLLHVLQGLSAKQIAASMGISEHTVRDHMKELHRAFEVQSRGELLAKFLSGKVA